MVREIRMGGATNRSPGVKLEGKEPMHPDEIAGWLTLRPEAEVDVLDGRPKEDRGVSIPVKGAQAVSEEDLIGALKSAGGVSSPEELFTRLALVESAVDSFYIALRSAVSRGTIRHTPPEGSERAILQAGSL